MMRETGPPVDNPALCPLCLSDHAASLVTKVAGVDGTFTILRCGQCETAFALETVGPDHIESWLPPTMLQILLEIELDLTTEARLLTRLGQPHAGRLLHIGCGLGFLVDMARHALGWDAQGMDGSALAFEGERLLGLDIEQAFLGTDSVPEGSFDAIIVSSGLAQCEEPREVLAVLRDALAPAGHLWMEVPTELSRPGFQKFGASIEGLSRCLLAAGFAAPVAIAAQGRIVISAGQPMGAIDEAAAAALRRDYLRDLCRRIERGSWLWNGAMGQLLHTCVVSGAEAEAEAEAAALVAEIAAVWGGRFDIHPMQPGLIVTRPLNHLVPTAPGKLFPLNLGQVLLDIGELLGRSGLHEPAHRLQVYRKAFSIATETACYLANVGRDPGRVAVTAQQARCALAKGLQAIVPELSYDLLGGMSRPSGTPLDAILQPASKTVLDGVVQQFMEAVNEGRYWDAGRIDHLLSDVARMRAVLSDDPARLFHLLYCLGILSLNGRGHAVAAVGYFRELLAATESAGQSMGAAQYRSLAESHIAIAAARLPVSPDGADTT